MQCCDCLSDNRENVKYCTHCGHPLIALCQRCGASIEVNDRFCGTCGVKLPATAYLPPRSEEPITQPAELVHLPAKHEIFESARKHVTVLFADISGFTAMSERMDAEDVTNLMNGCLKRLGTIVTKYEGYIDKFIGDCIMAIFGAPIAHENDPELAIRAALEMNEAIRDYNKNLPIRLEKALSLHIGINSGMVVAGNVGSNQKMQYTVMGDTVNLAARLESIAGDSQIFVSKYTYNLTRNWFEFIEHEPIKVKGKKDLVAVYEVSDIKHSDRRTLHQTQQRSPLVGRTEELGLLKKRLECLLNGTSEIVILTSEAGIGKSRIQLEIQDYINEQRMQIVYGCCNSFNRQTSYYIFTEIFKNLFDMESEDLPQTMAAKLATNLPLLTGQDANALGMQAKEAIVYLGWIMGFDRSEEYDIPLQQMDALDIKFAIFKSIEWFFTELARHLPLVLVLEDLHYADISSVEVIQYLIESLCNTPIMLLILLRPEKRHPSANLPRIAQSSTKSEALEISIKNLNPGESDELVRNLLQREAVPEAILNMVRLRAEGNPFYIEAIVRDLLENDIITVKEGRPIEILQDIDRSSIPETIQGMLVSRIDKLPPKLKRILQIAATIGPIFKYELIEHIVPDPELEANLQLLAELDIVFEFKTFPEIEYCFKNLLTQEAAYACMLHQKQRELHHEVADAIRNLYSARLDDHFEVLAIHYRIAQDYLEAYNFQVKSGLKAKKIHANQNVIEHFHNALETYARIKETPDSSMLALPICDVYIYLSEIQELTGDLEQATASLENALATLNEPLKIANLKRNIGRILEKKGEKEMALSLYRKVHELLKEHPDSLELGRLLVNESWVLNRMRRHDDAINKCMHALQLFENLNSAPDLAQAHNNLAVYFECRNELELAMAHNKISIELCLKYRNTRKLANVYLSMGYVHNKRGEFATAVEFFDKSIATMEKIGNRYGMGTALMAKGRGYLDLDLLEEAEHVLHKALQIHKSLRLPFKIVANEITLAKVYIRQGNLEVASAHLAYAREIAGTHNNASDLAKIAHIEARILAENGADASDKFQEAINHLKALGREQEVAWIMQEFKSGKVSQS